MKHALRTMINEAMLLAKHCVTLLDPTIFERLNVWVGTEKIEDVKSIDERTDGLLSIKNRVFLPEDFKSYEVKSSKSLSELLAHARKLERQS